MKEAYEKSSLSFKLVHRNPDKPPPQKKNSEFCEARYRHRMRIIARDVGIVVARRLDSDRFQTNTSILPWMRTRSKPSSSIPATGTRARIAPRSSPILGGSSIPRTTWCKLSRRQDYSRHCITNISGFSYSPTLVDCGVSDSLEDYFGGYFTVRKTKNFLFNSLFSKHVPRRTRKTLLMPLLVTSQKTLSR